MLIKNVQRQRRCLTDAKLASTQIDILHLRRNRINNKRASIAPLRTCKTVIYRLRGPEIGAALQVVDSITQIRSRIAQTQSDNPRKHVMPRRRPPNTQVVTQALRRIFPIVAASFPL